MGVQYIISWGSYAVAMNKKEIKSKPPYPTLGEIIQLLATAFGTKSANAEIRKKLDRLAREGDFDWSLPSQIVDELLLKPLDEFDPDYSEFVGDFVIFILKEHVNLISRISLDAMSRRDATPLLFETRGVRHVAEFLIALKEQFGGPDLGDFLGQDASPLDVVFQWCEVTLELDVANLLFSGNKQKRDDIARWRRGETVPDFFASIRPIRRSLMECCPGRQSEISLFGKWLITARALSWLMREAEKVGLGSLIGPVRQDILLNCPVRDIGMKLSTANSDAGHRLREVAECCAPLMLGGLSRTKDKLPEAQSNSRGEIDRLKGLINNHDADGLTGYILDWCEGRWHILAGDEVKALAFYDRAADLALYRAGDNQKQILEEALSLAAHLGKKTVIKKLKHRALAMGFFSELFAEFSDHSDVVSDWEIDQLSQAFSVLFPIHARFPRALKRKQRTAPFPFRAFYQPDSNKRKPDLSNPDRVIGFSMADGTKIRRPQLIWFASEDRVDDVRKLLKAGADVNISDHQSGSALLNALQCAEDGRGRQVLDLLLDQIHDKETLNRMTEKKRLSPLYVAVLLGDPIVVEKLLRMGADPNLQASYPPQTALYVCIERFAFYRQGWGEAHFRQRMAAPQKEDAEIHRRYSGGLAGAMGDRMSIEKFGPEGANLMDALIKHFVQKVSDVPRGDFLRIAELLLTFGADPNRKHSSPGPGRTPLMLAAENDALDAFRLMTAHAGDPNLKDDQGHDCFALACGFGSQNVMSYLKCGL